MQIAIGCHGKQPLWYASHYEPAVLWVIWRMAENPAVIQAHTAQQLRIVRGAKVFRAFVLGLVLLAFLRSERSNVSDPLSTSTQQYSERGA
ncbi:hypothetical protein WCQ02_17805 [Paraburkholderia tropica]|uniref:hypothetical protein n=1 Tax=Paraburkholderia tropica TaxID=92647 RepID=UPI0030170FD6